MRFDKVVRYTVAAVLTIGTLSAAYAANDTTFNADVLPIVQENCQVCHRAGGANLGGMVAPMAFEGVAQSR